VDGKAGVVLQNSKLKAGDVWVFQSGNVRAENSTLNVRYLRLYQRGSDASTFRDCRIDSVKVLPVVMYGRRPGGVEFTGSTITTVRNPCLHILLDAYAGADSRVVLRDVKFIDHTRDNGEGPALELGVMGARKSTGELRPAEIVDCEYDAIKYRDSDVSALIKHHVDVEIEEPKGRPAEGIKVAVESTLGKWATDQGVTGKDGRCRLALTECRETKDGREKAINTLSIETDAGDKVILRDFTPTENVSVQYVLGTESAKVVWEER